MCAEVDGAELELDAASEASLEGNAVKTRNMATLRGYAESSCEDGERVVRFRFLVSPVEVVGEGGRVTGVRIERNRLVAREDGYMRAVGTGETEVVPCGMVIRSVGYRGMPLPGVPFDEKRGIVPNEGGRVVRGVGGAAVPGEYVVGWAKRGPSGVIGTNKADAAATAALMCEDRGAGVVAGGEPSAWEGRPGRFAAGAWGAVGGRGGVGAAGRAGGPRGARRKGGLGSSSALSRRCWGWPWMTNSLPSHLQSVIPARNTTLRVRVLPPTSRFLKMDEIPEA